MRPLVLPILHQLHLSTAISVPQPPQSKPIRPQGTLTVHQVDLGAQEEDLVSQALGSGQHLSVVGTDEILHELLKLVPVHLGESLGDGQSQLHLIGMPNSVQ